MVQAHLVLSQTQFISPRSNGSQSGEWYSEAKTWVLGVLVAVGMLLLPGPFRGWSYGREQLSCTTVGNMCVFLHIMSIYTCVHSSIYLSIHPSVCEFNRNFPFHSPAQFHLVLSLFIVVTPFSDGEETTPIIYNILLYVTSLPLCHLLPPLPPRPSQALAPFCRPLQPPSSTVCHPPLLTRLPLRGGTPLTSRGLQHSVQPPPSHHTGSPLSLGYPCPRPQGDTCSAAPPDGL